jgi:hypothetical protein
VSFIALSRTNNLAHHDNRESLGAGARGGGIRGTSTAGLLEIVGARRSGFPPELVAEAEKELTARAAPEALLFRAKVRRSGTICAILGGLGGGWGLAMAVMARLFFSDVGPTNSNDFLFRHFNTIYFLVACGQAVAGTVLLVGGLELRKLRDRGRRLVLSVLWLVMGYFALFTAWWVSYMTLQFPAEPMTIIMAVFGVAISGAWAFLLWLPIRFFHSPRVEQACRSA